MTNTVTQVKRTVSISAVVTRADGTVEDHGVICADGNILRAAYRRIKRFMRKGLGK